MDNKSIHVIKLLITWQKWLYVSNYNLLFIDFYKFPHVIEYQSITFLSNRVHAWYTSTQTIIVYKVTLNISILNISTYIMIINQMSY